MRTGLAFGVAAAALLAAGAASAKEPTVEIRYAVARVVVVPEARSDIKVSFRSANASLPIAVRVEGDKTIVDGGLGGKLGGDRIRSCRVINDKASVTVSGVGVVKYEDMPEIVIQAPMNARVAAGGAVFGSVGRTDSLMLSSAGCGDWTVANVEGEMNINVAGSGDVRAGSAGKASLNIAGSGDVATTGVRGPVSINLGGSGDVHSGPIGGSLSVNSAGSGDADVASVNGAVSIRIAGSGDVLIRGGQAQSLSASIVGSGDVLFTGSAGKLDANVVGSGDVRVASVSGGVTKRAIGSGDVTVGGFAIDKD